MCYDLSFSSSIESIREYFPYLNISSQLSFEKIFHQQGHSFGKWLVIVDYGDGPELDLMTWGPLPNWMRKPDAIKAKRRYYLNAQSEKFLDKGSEWNKMKDHRCIIITTGFFEYHLPTGWKEDNKVCFYINEGGALISIAGLWKESMVPTKKEDGKWDYENLVTEKTFTLATREANTLLTKLHNSGENPHRMPLILPKNIADSWVKPGATDFQIQEMVNYEAQSAEFSFWPVSSVRKKHGNDESVIAPINVPGMPEVAA